MADGEIEMALFVLRFSRKLSNWKGNSPESHKYLVDKRRVSHQIQDDDDSNNDINDDFCSCSPNRTEEEEKKMPRNLLWFQYEWDIIHFQYVRSSNKMEHVQSHAVYDREYIDILWIIEWKNVIDP